MIVNLETGEFYYPERDNENNNETSNNFIDGVISYDIMKAIKDIIENRDFILNIQIKISKTIVHGIK